jgi:hypothetical protein
VSLNLGECPSFLQHSSSEIVYPVFALPNGLAANFACLSVGKVYIVTVLLSGPSASSAQTREVSTYFAGGRLPSVVNDTAVGPGGAVVAAIEANLEQSAGRQPKPVHAAAVVAISTPTAVGRMNAYLAVGGETFTLNGAVSLTPR